LSYTQALIFIGLGCSYSPDVCLVDSNDVILPKIHITGAIIMIKGNKVELVPATLEDRQNVYDWCFQSETTKSHSGLPDYPEAPIATWEQFCEDYTDYYFTGTQPSDGKVFIIRHDGEPVGFINYSSFHLKPHTSELDICIGRESNCGKGLGTDAIITLGNYLNKTLGIHELIIRPSVKNTRAIESYKKAGFVISDTSPCNYLRDEYVVLYGDGDYGAGGSMLLVKRFGT
jgi:RimJ/RimL family protein N-acetyltransferase